MHFVKQIGLVICGRFSSIYLLDLSRCNRHLLATQTLPSRIIKMYFQPPRLRLGILCTAQCAMVHSPVNAIFTLMSLARFGYNKNTVQSEVLSKMLYKNIWSFSGTQKLLNFNTPLITCSLSGWCSLATNVRERNTRNRVFFGDVCSMNW